MSRTFAGGASTDRVSSSSTIVLGTTMSVYWRFNTTTEDGTARRMFQFGDGVSAQLESRVTTGVIDFRAGWSTTTGVWTITSPGTGTNHDILWTYDASATTNDPLCWMDGVSVTVNRITGPAGTWSPTAMTFHIGNDASATRCYTGTIQGPALWPDLRAAFDAVRMSSGSAPCSVAKPSLYYPLDLGESPEPELMVANNGTVTGTTFTANPVGLIKMRCRDSVPNKFMTRPRPYAPCLAR